MSDTELSELLGFDSVVDMLSAANADRDKLFIDTCAGQWIRFRSHGSRWHLNEAPNDQ